MIRHIIMIATALLASPAQAELSCQDMYVLARLMDVAQSDVPLSMSLDHIATDIAEANQSANTSIEVNSDFAALQPFSLLAMQLAEDARRQDTDAMLRRLRNQQSVQTIARTMDVLVRQGCAAVPVAQHPGALQSPASASDMDQDKRDPPTILEISLFSLAVLILAMLSVYGSRVWFRYQRQRRRRHRRYPCYIHTDLKVGDATYDVTLLDISGYGVKLRYDEFQTDIGTKVQLRLKKQRHKADIAWVNSHYVGLKFEKGLRLVTIFEVLGKSMGKGAKNTKPSDSVRV